MQPSEPKRKPAKTTYAGEGGPRDAGPSRRVKPLRSVQMTEILLPVAGPLGGSSVQYPTNSRVPITDEYGQERRREPTPERVARRGQREDRGVRRMLARRRDANPLQSLDLLLKRWEHVRDVRENRGVPESMRFLDQRDPLQQWLWEQALREYLKQRRPTA